MRSTFYGLEIAKTGLNISQNQLDITAHNISNVDTTGFTRQRLYTSAIAATSTNSLIAFDKTGVSGRGVTAITVEQVRSPFLDFQFRNQNSTATKYSVKEQYFEYVEALFNNELEDISSSTGLSSVLSDFYSSLYSLSNSPSDSEIRANVQQNAIKLTETINDYYTTLAEQQNTLNESVKVTVKEINDYAQQIADLNKAIYSYELTGQTANDLRDQRNILLDELSGIVDYEYSEESNGKVNIKIDDNYLVHGFDTKKMVVDATLDNPIKAGAANRLYEVYWADESGVSTGKKVDIKDGALSGYLEIRDGNTEANVGIPYIVGQLDGLCKKIVTEVNAIHKTGYTFPNSTNGSVSQTGVNFFQDTSVAQDGSEVTAANFAVSSEVLASVFNIAASDTQVATTGTENEQRGNGKIALALCKLINKTDSTGNQDNFNSAFKTIVTGIGIEMDSINTTASTQSTMLKNLSTQRNSVSGVSLDDEMSNIVKFQHAYTAASRVITAMDEQLDTLINRMGLVGIR